MRTHTEDLKCATVYTGRHSSKTLYIGWEKPSETEEGYTYYVSTTVQMQFVQKKVLK